MPAMTKPNFIEKVDRQALEFCIERFLTLPMRQSVKEDPETKNKLIEYYNKLDSTGKVKITYKQVNSILERGRWFSCGVSLQNIPREIRNTIAGKYYYDLDIVNAHPVLLAQICDNKNISCDHLKNYIKNRDELFEQLGLPRDDAKQLILSIMNGGNMAYNKVKGKYTWLDEFYNEINNILTMISMIDKEEFKKQSRRRIEQGKDYNHKGSYVNCLLCKAENQILEAMAQYIESKDFKIGTYMFDGLTIYKKSEFKEFPNNILDECKQYIKDKTGYSVNIIEKPMKTDITIAEDYETMYKRWKKKFEEKVAFVVNVTSFIQQIGNSYKLKSREQLRHTFEPELDNLTKWLKDPLRKTYNRIDFLPRPIECPPDVYNIYNGLEIEKQEDSLEYNPESAKPIYDLINVLMNHDTECVQYFIKWVAHMIQYPGLKNNIAIIIQSVPGVGKGIFLNILSSIIGKDYYITTSEPDNDIFGSFNGILANKLLVNMDETKEEDTTKYIDRIKTLITEEALQIKMKGKETYTVQNHTRWIFTTNKEIPVKFEPGERRFWGINADGTNANNMTFLKPIIEASKNPNALYTFYKDMMEQDVLGYDFINNRPQTEFMLNIQEVSSDKLLEFINHIMRCNENEILETGKVSMPITQWYSEYKAFCRTNNEIDRITLKTFSMLLCKKPGINKHRSNIGVIIELQAQQQ